jgi:hypothetical protein
VAPAQPGETGEAWRIKVMRSLACVLVALSAPARAAVPDPALERLAIEMVSHPPTKSSTAMELYARAFVGYALVDLALDTPEYRPRAAALLDRLAAQMALPASGARFHTGETVIAGRKLSSSAAQRGHLALVLVGRELIAPRKDPFLRELSRGLARDLERAPNHLLPTYDRRAWPADNEVIAAALALYAARVEADPVVLEGLYSLEKSLATLEARGLPPSEVAPGTLRGIDVARGCALSWSVAMRGLHDRAGAERLYRGYRAAFFTDLGAVVGFREWPRGVTRSGDDDSGPIVLGIGVAASGIGLGAARLVGASTDEWRLRASAQAAGLSAVERLGGKISWVPRAMALWARTARAW